MYKLFGDRFIKPCTQLFSLTISKTRPNKVIHQYLYQTILTVTFNCLSVTNKQNKPEYVYKPSEDCFIKALTGTKIIKLHK